MKNIFDKTTTDEVIGRIEKLTNETQAQWGKMDVAQMLAHCCVSYEYVYEEDKYKKPKGLKKFMLKSIVKPMVTNEKAYKKNGRTAPDFIIADKREFEKEKARLIEFLNKTQALGEDHFDGKDSHSFGKLSKAEWNNMFYKHLDHHLGQFGV